MQQVNTPVWLSSPAEACSVSQARHLPNICLQGLQPKLEAIKAAKNRGARALLVFLKANHPPKFGRNLPEPEYDDLKKALRNASTDYHPDRQTGGDKVWQMLSQEITKHINEVWADYKS